MATFVAGLQRFRVKVDNRARAVFTNVASAAKFSVTDGSGITASPGQPVDTGNLKASWQLTFPDPWRAEITTACEYARSIEYNLRGATLRSQVGGFHSVALTVGGFRRLVAAVNAETPR